MPGVDILGPAIGIVKWIVEKLYDRFEAAHGVHLELAPGLVGYSDGSRVPFIILTVRNRGAPQRVEDVALWLSNGQYLLMPEPDPAFAPTPAMVTMTEKYETGFRLDRVKADLDRIRSQSERHAEVIGARVRLVSGRAVKLKRKIDIEERRLVQHGTESQ